MLQIHTNCFKNTDRPCECKGVIMPAADKAEWLDEAWPIKTGPSGYLKPGVYMHILE